MHELIFVNDLGSLAVYVERAHQQQWYVDAWIRFVGVFDLLHGEIPVYLLF